MARGTLSTAALATILSTLAVAAQPAPAPLPTGLTRTQLQVPSSIDGTLQPSYVLVPTAESPSPRPLLVLLHTWSFDYEQRNLVVEREAVARNWVVLIPNFRGPNNHADACGAPVAQQDILDAVTAVRSRYPIDAARTYLFGWSGGGHMSLLMAARHPHMWTAASASVPITDLEAFYEQHSEGAFGRDLRACFGGAPTDPQRRAAYQAQSPLMYLRPQLQVPLDLVVGIHDVQVSPSHTLNAFRAVAPGALSDQEFAWLSKRAPAPAPDAQQITPPVDPGFTRPIILRRASGKHRFTAFDGGHDVFTLSAVDWLSQWHR